MRTATTRIQVLVVATALLVISAAVLVAIPRIRESANEMSCSSNLRQLGLAIHNYHDVTDELPPLVDQGKHSSTGKGLPSMFANLMPFIEATPQTFRKEKTADYYHGHSSVALLYQGKRGDQFVLHGGMANWMHRLFLDPSDQTAINLRDIEMTLPDGSIGYYATGGYAANGMVPWNGGKFAMSFPGGLSQTILVGERPQVCQASSGETVYNLWGLGFYSPHMPAFAALAPNEPGMQSTNQIAPAMPLTCPARIRIGRIDAETESPSFEFPVQRYRPGQPCDPRLPASPHRKGMQVLLGDGSVRFDSFDTDARVFWAACVASGAP